MKSSGHDYIGRSSWSGSIQINLGYMRKMNVQLSSSRSVDGELTVEGGANWQEIYQEVCMHIVYLVNEDHHRAYKTICFDNTNYCHKLVCYFSCI